MISFAIKLVCLPLLVPYNIISSLYYFISPISPVSGETKTEPALSFSFLKNAWYIITGDLTAQQSARHASVFKLNQSTYNKFLLLGTALLTSVILFSLGIYASVYLYSAFTQSFSAGAMSAFTSIFYKYMGLSILLGFVRASNKFLRKYTQNLITRNLRYQWVTILGKVHAQALTEESQKNIAQLIEEETEEATSHSVIMFSQIIYMTCDMCFFFIYLYFHVPNLVLLAIGTATVAWLLLDTPGKKQEHYQKLDKIYRTELRKEIDETLQATPLIRGTNGFAFEEKQLKKKIDRVSNNYISKIAWESLYSLINRLIKYLSIPAAFCLIAPAYATGLVSFGVVMSSLRCYKDFLSAATLIISNRKMVNKLSVSVKRLYRTYEDTLKQKSYEQQQLKKNYRLTTDNGIML